MKPNSSYRHCFDPDVSHECIYRDRVRKPAFAPRLPNGAKSGAPIFAADLGALPELIGVIVAASTITGVFFKLPSGALSDVLGRKRMMVLGALFFAAPPFLYPFVHDPWSLLALRFVHGFATAIFLRSPRPMWRAWPRPGAALGSAGSRQRTISARPEGRSSAGSFSISRAALR